MIAFEIPINAPCVAALSSVLVTVTDAPLAAAYGAFPCKAPTCLSTDRRAHTHRTLRP